MLDRVNKQIFKVNYKNWILFLLTVLFCCNVGENGDNISVGNGPLHKLHKNSSIVSENEVLYQKVLCILFYKSKEKLHRDVLKRCCCKSVMTIKWFSHPSAVSSIRWCSLRWLTNKKKKRKKKKKSRFLKVTLINASLSNPSVILPSYLANATISFMRRFIRAQIALRRDGQAGPLTL